MVINRRKGSKIYYMHFINNDGKRIRQSTGTTSLTNAQKLLEKLKSDIHHKPQ